MERIEFETKGFERAVVGGEGSENEDRNSGKGRHLKRSACLLFILMSLFSPRRSSSGLDFAHLA